MKICACTITATYETPSTEGMSKSKRQQLQHQHFSHCRGHQPFMPMPSVMFYIVDILRNLLRLMPQIFLLTLQENCDVEQLKEVGQWCSETLSLIIIDDIYLPTAKGVKNLNVSAESWSGSTRRLLLDNFETVMEIALKDHDISEIERVSTQRHLQFGGRFSSSITLSPEDATTTTMWMWKHMRKSSAILVLC
jgi:hypothetical protein